MSRSATPKHTPLSSARQSPRMRHPPPHGSPPPFSADVLFASPAFTPLSGATAGGPAAGGVAASPAPASGATGSSDGFVHPASVTAASPLSGPVSSSAMGLMRSLRGAPPA